MGLLDLMRVSAAVHGLGTPSEPVVCAGRVAQSNKVDMSNLNEWAGGVGRT